LLAGHKRRLAYVISRDEEVSAPSKRFQFIGDRRVRTHSSVIECKHPSPRQCGSISRQVGYQGRVVGNEAPDHIEVSLELVRLKFVERGVGAGKTARSMSFAFDNVMVHQRYYPILFRFGFHMAV
jgi:hypothetical protein